VPGHQAVVAVALVLEQELLVGAGATAVLVDEGAVGGGVVRDVQALQPDAVTTLRSGWIGDFASEEGPSVPTGGIRTGKLAEKTFTIGGAWGYKAGTSVMSFGTAMNIMVNAWVRNITCLVNVGPDRTGVVPTAQADLVRRIGSFMTTCGEAVYGTTGGPGSLSTASTATPTRATPSTCTCCPATAAPRSPPRRSGTRT
jgi:hypothetical protein